MLTTPPPPKNLSIPHQFEIPRNNLALSRVQGEKENPDHYLMKAMWM